MTDERAPHLRGLLTALNTPFDSNGALALQHLPAYVDRQREEGADGIVFCGTNGEGPSLSVSERRAVFEAAAPLMVGMVFVAGTGAASMPDAVELTRAAADCGADGVLVLPPFYFREATSAGLEAYYRAVLDAAPIPVLLYSIPQFTGIPITDDLIDRLIDHPNLAGVKDSTGDWNRAAHLIARYPGLRIFPGSDLLAVQGWASGAAGMVSGGANVFCRAAAAVRDAPDARTAGPAARAAQERLTGLMHILNRWQPIAAAKALSASQGLPRTHVRAPLTDLDPGEVSALTTAIAEAAPVAAP